MKESAQQIWLAGMGAFSKAQEEGTKVFEALVKEMVESDFSSAKRDSLIKLVVLPAATVTTAVCSGGTPSKAPTRWTTST